MHEVGVVRGVVPQYPTLQTHMDPVELAFGSMHATQSVAELQLLHPAMHAAHTSGESALAAL